MGRRRNRNWRLRVERAAMERIAGALVPNHAELVDAGYVVCGTSGLWQTRGGRITARIAYRSRRLHTSISHTIRGIDPGWFNG